VLIVLARHLPEGTLKELASFLPDCMTTVRRLREHPQVAPLQDRGRDRRAVGAVADRLDS